MISCSHWGMFEHQKWTDVGRIRFTPWPLLRWQDVNNYYEWPEEKFVAGMSQKYGDSSLVSVT